MKALAIRHWRRATETMTGRPLLGGHTVKDTAQFCRRRLSTCAPGASRPQMPRAYSHTSASSDYFVDRRTSASLSLHYGPRATRPDRGEWWPSRLVVATAAGGGDGRSCGDSPGGHIQDAPVNLVEGEAVVERPPYPGAGHPQLGGLRQAFGFAPKPNLPRKGWARQPLASWAHFVRPTHFLFQPL